MKPLFLQYPACSTCQKAKKWLTENNIEYTNRLIVEENPTIEEEHGFRVAVCLSRNSSTLAVWFIKN